jgi:hypothetical protein
MPKKYVIQLVKETYIVTGAVSFYWKICQVVQPWLFGREKHVPISGPHCGIEVPEIIENIDQAKTMCLLLNNGGNPYRYETEIIEVR